MADGTNPILKARPKQALLCRAQICSSAACDRTTTACHWRRALPTHHPKRHTGGAASRWSATSFTLTISIILIAVGAAPIRFLSLSLFAVGHHACCPRPSHRLGSRCFQLPPPDALFFSRVLARRWVPDDAISHVLITDGSDIVRWSAEQLRVVLGESLLQRVVFLPKRHASSSSRAQGEREREEQQLKASLSNHSLLPQPPSLLLARLRGGESQRPPRFVCFDAMVEKLVQDPVDRSDLAWMRARAYAHCGVEAATPRLLLLILRGEESLGDKPTTCRQVANPLELRHGLEKYASERGLRLHATAFAGMRYCEQVRLAASAQLLVGVHGQAITNGQFMRDDGVVVELFHGGTKPFWKAFDNVGHQPLYLGAGRPYVAAPLAETRCGMMQWKHQPSCKSYVNVSKLAEVLRQAEQLFGPK